MFVYAFGFLVFAFGPYLLVLQTITTQRAWLELSLLILRLSASAMLVLLGWVTTVGAISILSRDSYVPVSSGAKWLSLLHWSFASRLLWASPYV
jgi:hypothetical protein